jgi:cytochrome c oxidase subunit 2
MDQLVAQGQTVYTTFCMACHQQNGQGLPPAFPALTGSAIALGPIEDHVNIVLNGKAGTAMAAYGALLSPVDLAAVVTYERNAIGNSVGDMVTPVQILEMQAAAE